MGKKIIIINWLKIDDLVNDILDKIIKNDFLPDCIVGIARGGLIPAVMLSHKLQCRSMGFIQYQRTQNDSPFSMTNNNILHCIGIPDKKINKILIVDDIIVEGVIFDDAVKKIMAAYESPEILGAFLYKVKTKADRVETYHYVYSEIIEDDKWVIYPWENYSNTSNIKDVL